MAEKNKCCPPFITKAETTANFSRVVEEEVERMNNYRLFFNASVVHTHIYEHTDFTISVGGDTFSPFVHSLLDQPERLGEPLVPRFKQWPKDKHWCNAVFSMI